MDPPILIINQDFYLFLPRRTRGRSLCRVEQYCTSSRCFFKNVELLSLFLQAVHFHDFPEATLSRCIQRLKDVLCMCQFSSRQLRRITHKLSTRMELVDETVSLATSTRSHPRVLEYEIVQGAMVRWSSLMGKSAPDPPTAVLVHGILGSRKNWGAFARRLAENFPSWQFLLVDLRCHGDSAAIKKTSPHTVTAAALDILKLVAQLRITPRVLVGHSFGGKVVLSMVKQAAKPLARPVKVWVLDATPGKARPGLHGEDHPAELIAALERMPKERGFPEKRLHQSVMFLPVFSKKGSQWT